MSFRKPKNKTERSILLLIVMSLICLVISAAQAEGSVKLEMKSINGIQISVKEAGKGPDLILVHGRSYRKEGMDAFLK